MANDKTTKKVIKKKVFVNLPGSRRDGTMLVTISEDPVGDTTSTDTIYTLPRTPWDRERTLMGGRSWVYHNHGGKPIDWYGPGEISADLVEIQDPWYYDYPILKKIISYIPYFGE